MKINFENEISELIVITPYWRSWIKTIKKETTDEQ